MGVNSFGRRAVIGGCLFKILTSPVIENNLNSIGE